MEELFKLRIYFYRSCLLQAIVPDPDKEHSTGAYIHSRPAGFINKL